MVTPKKIALFVSFQSDRTATAAGGSTPDTSPLGDVNHPMISSRLRVKGVFHLIGALNLQPPELGTVNATMHVETRWGGDETWKRLAPLVPRFFKDDKPVLVVAIGEKGDEILDYTFVGPFQNDQKDTVESLCKYLVKHPFKNLSRDQAEAMLKEKNYVTVLAGLVWLNNDNASKPSDFLNASLMVPRAEVADVVDQMFRQLLMQDATKDYKSPEPLSVALAAFLKGEDAGRITDTVDAMRSLFADKNANAVRVYVWDRAAINSAVVSAIKAKEAQGSKDPSVLNLIKSLHALMDVTAGLHWP